MRRMCPRLQLQLLADRLRKTPAPPPPRIRPVHIDARLGMHKVRVTPNVVVYGSQLDQLA